MIEKSCSANPMDFFFEDVNIEQVREPVDKLDVVYLDLWVLIRSLVRGKIQAHGIGDNGIE